MLNRTEVGQDIGFTVSVSDLPRQRQSLLIQRLSFAEVPEVPLQFSKIVQRGAFREWVLISAVQLQRLVQHRL